MTKNSNNENLKDIDYDGIRECDNDLPKWWLWTFYVSIIFSVIYMWYYHAGGPGKSEVLMFEEAMQAEKTMMPVASVSGGDLYDEDKLKSMKTNKGFIAKGEQTYKTKCMACHGTRGEGGIGPNFTDNYWIHGGKLSQITKTIHDGVPEKGMVAWGALMSNEEIISVAFYIKSLKGSNPPNQKPPQGIPENE